MAFRPRQGFIYNTAWKPIQPFISTNSVYDVRTGAEPRFILDNELNGGITGAKYYTYITKGVGDYECYVTNSNTEICKFYHTDAGVTRWHTALRGNNYAIERYTWNVVSAEWSYQTLFEGSSDTIWVRIYIFAAEGLEPTYYYSTQTFYLNENPDPTDNDEDTVLIFQRGQKAWKPIQPFINT